ncbi:MAG: hypothetical protein IJ594_01865 [Oscillospiraceae bacterium]|nr:hypothetical protein [Oscillospiraceae bacterium]
MKRGWKVVSMIILVAILLGAVGVGVGLMTGGDVTRVADAFDERYHLWAYIDLYSDYVRELVSVVGDALRAPGA